MIYILKAGNVSDDHVAGYVYVGALELHDTTKQELAALRNLTEDEFNSTDTTSVAVQAVEAIRTASKDHVIAIEDFFKGRKATLVVDDHEGTVWTFAPTKTHVKVTYVDHLLKP